jgi:peptidoglycan hydrolase-like protein with peptidoglycan-binding domain
LRTSWLALAWLVGSASQLGLAAENVTYTYQFRRELAQGARGADVMELQAALIDLGYLRLTPAEPTGTFGSLTKAALTRLQAERDLKPARPGVLDASTRGVVGSRTLKGSSHTVDFRAICSMPTRISYLGLYGHVEIELLGVVSGQCSLRYGMETENPEWDGTLDHVCKVPLKSFVFNLSDQVGADLGPLGAYCSVSKSN